MLGTLYRHRHLVWEFVKRSLLARYRGSVLGIFWAMAQPVLMLVVFTTVFSGILGQRFNAGDPPLYWPLYMFCGLLPWTVFNETVAASPRLVLNYPSLVKKVVFPLEILPATVFLTSLINSLFGLAAFLVACTWMKGITWSVLWLPVLMVPLAFWSLGLSWFLASLGVYLRDLGEIIGLVMTAWFFLTPIFYPIQHLSAGKQLLFNLNPMWHVVRDFRACAIEGGGPSFGWLAGSAALGGLVCAAGFAWFRRTKAGFADVM